MYYHHYHQGILTALILLSLSHHPSLSIITLGKSLAAMTWENFHFILLARSDFGLYNVLLNVINSQYL